MHDRMLFLLTHMIGMSVEVTVKNGSKYEGLFHTAFTEGDLGIVLRLVKVISGKDKKENAPLVGQLIILAKDCVAVNVLGVDFVPHERSGIERSNDREGFKTDTDISRSGDIKERDLKKWAPEEHSSIGGIEDDLSESHFGNNHTASWDQFAVNEKLFGVRTDFDEELYTTKLDRSGADFKTREQQAIQIANEIQQSVSNNVHMQEERGLAVDDSGLDEEDRYGAVVRNPLPPSNKYMPPAMRRQQELQQQKRPTTPTHQPTRGSPPPATQVTGQAPVEAKALNQTTLTQQKTAVEETLPAASSMTNSTSAKPAEPAIVSRSNSTKTSNGQFNLNELRTHNPVSALLNAATIQGSKNQQIPDNAMDAQHIEESLARFAQTARSFASKDKVLVNQTKLDLTQRRTELLQKEKDDFAAELKQFGEELTKKLTNTPVPDDVKEIFGKKMDKDKSKELAGSSTKLSEKTEKASTTESKTVKDKEAEPSAVATPQKSASEKETTTAAAHSFKLNVKASVFKPNANATPFTPSFGGTDKKTGSPLTPTPAGDKNLFFGKTIRKGPLLLQESMSNPFKKSQAVPGPSSITPTWPYGQRSFRHLFTVTNRYEEDLYNQGMSSAQHGATSGYYAMAPYSYGSSGQYGGPPSMALNGPNHMIPFIPNGGPVPFSQPPPSMPHTGAGQGYPQVTAASAAHYAQQGFTPNRSGIIPPSGMHLPMYAYPPNPHNGPVMMRYPPPDMMPPMAPNGMMMHQRPLGMEPQMANYPLTGREPGSVHESVDSASP
ncbi:hypothetical protein BGZ83_008881 [Gryganskiella cystojenkinii]|nr:hypothetical protein BGZ83_008881 [Gryganskiella cystojenkinii]